VGAPALFVVLWSTGFVFAREAIKYAPPMTILTIRFAAATALSGGLVLIGGVRWPRGRALGHTTVVGLLLHGAYIGGVFAAIGHGLPAGVAAVIVGLQPLLSACVVGSVLGERVTPLQWLGCALGLGGVVLVVLTRLTFDGTTVAGLLLAVLALFGITAGTLYQKRYCADVDIRAASVIQYATACLAVLVFALAFESLSIDWTASLVGSLAWMAGVLSVGTVSLLYVLIRRGGAVRTASLFYLVPPLTVLIAYLWFGETLGATALAGIALAAAGVALVQRGGGETPRSEPVTETV
jgi:drug/metabolite transporter (DMT)-like permease